MPPPKSATDADELRAVSFQVSIFVALRHTIIGITVSIHFLTYPRLFLHSKSSCWHVNVLKKKKEITLEDLSATLPPQRAQQRALQ